MIRTRPGFVPNPVDGVRTHYEIFGPEEATRTILFCPAGLYVHSRVWKMQVPYFARNGFRVITYDCRGSGRSGRPGTGYSPDLLAGDVLAILDVLDIERAALVGITWAIRWMGPIASRHPERVTHLISVSSFPALHTTEPLTDPSEIRVSVEAIPSRDQPWRPGRLAR